MKKLYSLHAKQNFRFRMIWLSFIFIAFVGVSGWGQDAVGDYRSNAASFNWGTANSWQVCTAAGNPGTWVTATAYPGQNTGTGKVTIQTGHVVTISNTPASIPNPISSLNIIGTLTKTGNNASMTITGNMYGSSGTITGVNSGGGFTFYINGNCSFNGAVNNRIVFAMNGTSDQIFNGVLSTSLYNFTVNKATGTLFINITPTVTTFTMTAGNVSYNGTTANQNILNATYPNNLTLSGSGTKILTTTLTTINGNFTLSGTASTTAAANLSIGGNVDIGSGTAFTAGAFTHYVGGNWTNNGTFTATGSTINFNGSGAGNIGASNFNNITFSGTGAKTANGALAIAGNVLISNNFTAGSYNHTVGGNWTNNGTFNAGGSTIVFRDPVTPPQVIGGTSVTTFNNFTGEKTTYEQLASDIIVDGILQLDKLDNEFNTIAINGKTLTLNGSVSGTGTLTGDANAVLVIGGSAGGNLGTLLFTSGAQTLKSLTLNRTGASPAATLGSDLSIGSSELTITSGVLSVDYGKALTVTGPIALNYTTSPCLVLKSDATGTASFIDNGTITGSGIAKIERWLAKYNAPGDYMFHFLSSPVGADQAIMPGFQTMTNTTDDFYMWDEPTGMWINTKQGTSSPFTWNTAFGSGNGAFVAGKGYLVAYPSDVTKEFIGKPYTSSTGLTMTCTNTNGTYSGWNLLGNPFPSALDWGTVVRGDGMDDALYYYDNTAAKYRYFIELSGGIGSAVSGGSKFIPAMQGFMVHAKTTGTKTVTMKNSDRKHENMNLYYKSSVLTDNVLNISVAGNNRTDEARVCFYDQATANFDGEFDAYKLFSYNTSVPELYSITTDQTQLAINTLPLSEMYGSVQLGFRPGTDGDYTFSAAGIENFPSAMYIKLEDKKTGTIQKLNDNSEYAFTASTSDDYNRFILHFQDATSVPANPTKETFTVYQNTDGINILTQPDVDARIRVTDMVGKVMLQGNTNGNSLTTLSASGLPNGVYVVNLISGNKVVSEKVVVSR